MAGFAMHPFQHPALGRLAAPAWSMSYGADTAELPGLVAPDAQVEIVFQLGAPCRVRAGGAETAGGAAMLYGLRHGALELVPAGANTIVAFRLPAVVAAFVLRAPLGDCWDRPVPLADLVGGEADDLVQRIAEDPDAAGQAIEAWLARRLSDWGGDETGQLAVHERLFWDLADEPVSRLAEEIGMTERTLRRRCATFGGLSPKQIVISGRILRACDLLRGRLPLAEVAQRVGFYDQAAFSNACRRYLGLTPAEVRALPLLHYERRR